MNENVKLDADIVEEIIKGRKINAIKKIRMTKGLGLREAKEMVDSYCLENEIEYSRSRETTSSKGLFIVIGLGIVLALLYSQFK